MSSIIKDIETNPTNIELKFPVKTTKAFLLELIKLNPQTPQDVQKMKSPLSKKYKIIPPNRELLYVYNYHLDDSQKIPGFHNLLMIKPGRSRSGVSPITVLLAPNEFSCGHDCAYCPDERIVNGAKEDMPRSYASTEPAVMRAIEVKFDAVMQVYSRCRVLKNNGHQIDKIEYIIEGGTFSDHKKQYTENFIRDLFYAANIWPTPLNIARARLTLEEEQVINETASARVIGVVVETRPDNIRWVEMKRFRMLGVTRVQIGVQHTDNEILKLINRGHTYETSKKAITLLKTAGFKVDIHVMPDLPGSTPDKDIEMNTKVLIDLAPDYMKEYPCLDVTFTKIRKWKSEGKWIPYSEKNNAEELIRVLLQFMREIPYHTRINRLQRDFPNETEKNGNVGYVSDHIRSNLHQILIERMEKEGIKCKSIRTREIGDRPINYNSIELQHYTITDCTKGIEYFISLVDSSQDALLGLCRLRIPSIGESETPKINVLKDGTAIVRELHVYGQIQKVGIKTQDKAQHHGFGTRLLNKAEDIALYHGSPRIAVISGVGVREFYRKFGYKLKETYMIKDLY